MEWKKMEMRQDWKAEDMEKNEEYDRRTMREIRKMVNSIERDIQMEEEVLSTQETGMLPILDFQAWKEEVSNEEGVYRTEIKWIFYEKKMSSRFVMMEDGALPMRMKTTVLAQEVIRRERNTSRNVDIETRRKIRNKFVLKLRMSGYSWRQRLNIMLSGLRGY